MKESLNILDALENLNTIVDATSLEEIEVAEGLLIPHKPDAEKKKEEYWIAAAPNEETFEVIRQTLSTINNYLQSFYTNRKKNSDPKRLMEGINTVMVLVGEAAKKLERFHTLFKNHVTEFEEYQKLQDFYRNRVIKESFKQLAKTTKDPLKIRPVQEVIPEHKEAETQLSELLEADPVDEIAGVHILNDIEVINRDHLYELFHLKNEAGHHFFSYELARTIKLACDFGEFAQYFADDPLLQIKNWEDKARQMRASLILKNCKRQIDLFYQSALRYKEMDLVMSVHKCVMALMLTANPRNLIRQFAPKGCHLYFQDFLLFLREALLNREYQKFMVYSVPSTKPFFQDLVELVDSLCFQIYTSQSLEDEVNGAVLKLLNSEEKKTLSSVLSASYQKLTEALSQHPKGPAFKALDLIREEEIPLYDPLHLGNIPAEECRLISGKKEIKVLRMPCPIQQEVIDRAWIIPEFENFLRGLKHNEKLLYVNFQDRTSWKEHARSLAIEELSRKAEFAENFIVVTLAKDTEFYNQQGIYQDLEEADLFIHQFLDHIEDEATGYYFPMQIKGSLFPDFMKTLMEKVYHAFFFQKAKLTLLERLDFIEITYLFIELKLIELTKPTYLAMGSKDGLDSSNTTSVALLGLLGIGQGKKWSELELGRLKGMLFIPTLMNRERAIHPERFERLQSVMALLEASGDFLKEFSPLYAKGSLDLEIQL